MTTRELIALLNNYPQDAPVWVERPDGEDGDPVSNVEWSEESGIVVIFGKEFK